MAIYFDNSNITTGSRGPEGPQGKTGPAGPSEISTDTATTLTGILKGNGSIVVVAEAGADYATPTAVANKQSKITAQGLLKGLGDGSVAAATPGADYASPAILRTVTLGVAVWTGAEAPFQQTVSVQGATADNPKVISPAYASIAEYAACGVKAAAEGAGTITFACDVAPENDLIVNILIVG